MCMWAIKEMVDVIGCTDDSKPRVDCDASDVCFIVDSYTNPDRHPYSEVDEEKGHDGSHSPDNTKLGVRLPRDDALPNAGGRLLVREGREGHRLRS